MSTISTRETLVSRESEMASPAANVTQALPAYARFLASPMLHKLTYLAGDVLAVGLAHLLAVRMVEHFVRISPSAMNPFEYHRFYIPFFAIILYLFDGYKSPELRRPEQELERSCKAVFVSFLGLVLFNFVVFRSEVFSRYLLLSWFVLASIMLIAARFTLRGILGRLWKARLARRRAVLAGSSSGLLEYQQLLSTQRHCGYEVIGILTDSAKPASPLATIPEVQLLGSLDQWEEALAAAEASVLIIAYPVISHGDEWLRELLRRCKELRVDVELYSCVLATANMNYEHDEFSGCFRYYAKAEWSVAVQRMLKRFMDLTIGLVGSAVTLLLAPIVWILVNLEDPGPVFHFREFVGSDGKIHYYRKFRTMLKGADDILRRNPQLKAEFDRQHKLKDDPRLLRCGRFMRRFSVDEFPQFFSVLSGRLTFVGPRVISGEEKHRYGPLLAKLLSSKPGLTGFWQVMGRQTTTYQERICMDMFYVDRWSIWLDLVIIAKTFWKVVRAEGAY
jgi:exopolysaccharide biosynthesis polyprenyl glycosylphosphotransferase